VHGSREDRVRIVREKMENKLLELSGVVGVSYGSPKIRLYVESKEHARSVPRFMFGVPVEVKVIGRVRFLPRYVANVVVNRTAKVRPLVGGISVGNELLKAAGTIAVITYDGYLLTNAHVIAFGSFDGDFASVGTGVVQPGLYDDPNAEVIGRLEDYGIIRYNDVNAANFFDAAIASVDVNALRGMVLCKGKIICKIDGYTDANVGDVVLKSGRTSGATEHIVTDTNATVKVYVNSNKWAVFRDCIMLEPRVLPGDSGSLVYMKRKAVGLVFAGSDKVGIACKIGKVIDRFGIDLGKYVKREKVEAKPDYYSFAKMIMPLASTALGVYLKGVK